MPAIFAANQYYTLAKSCCNWKNLYRWTTIRTSKTKQSKTKQVKYFQPHLKARSYYNWKNLDQSTVTTSRKKRRMQNLSKVMKWRCHVVTGRTLTNHIRKIQAIVAMLRSCNYNIFCEYVALCLLFFGVNIKFFLTTSRHLCNLLHVGNVPL